MPKIKDIKKGYNDPFENIRSNGYDGETTWSLQINMEAITARVVDVLTERMSAFVRDEIFSKGKSYPATKGTRVINALTVDELNCLAAKTEVFSTVRLPKTYEDYIHYTAKQVVQTIAYVMFKDFEGNNEEE
jgi:hypothetical protein